MSINFKMSQYEAAHQPRDMSEIHNPTLCEVFSVDEGKTEIALIFNYGAIFFGNKATYCSKTYLIANYTFIREMPADFELTMRNK